LKERGEERRREDIANEGSGNLWMEIEIIFFFGKCHPREDAFRIL